jgi:hypothetical protein
MLEVIFQLAAPLTESEPSSEFIQVIHGEIRDSESNTIVGRINSSLVQVGRVADVGADLFEVMDGQSREMGEYHAAFFTPNDWDYKDSIRRRFPDIISLDLLIIEHAEIQPAFRKRGVGLLAASRTIDVFGGNCGLVAMKPFPVQFSNYLDSGWRPPDGIGDPKAAFRAAREKLRSYWARAGFKRVNGTDYRALCPERKRPSLNTIAAAIEERCPLDGQPKV